MSVSAIYTYANMQLFSILQFPKAIVDVVQRHLAEMLMKSTISMCQFVIIAIESENSDILSILSMQFEML